MDQHQLHTQPRGERAARDLRGEVQDFLNLLARALIAGEGETVATLWAAPALVISEHGVRAFTSTDQLAKFFGGAKAAYNARGIVSTRADIIDLERIGHQLVIVSVRWPHLDLHGKTIGAETSDYTLRRDDAGKLRVCSALMRGVEPPRT